MFFGNSLLFFRLLDKSEILCGADALRAHSVDKGYAVS